MPPLEEITTLWTQKPLLMVLLLALTLAGWEIYRLAANLAGIITGILVGVMAAGLLPLEKSEEITGVVVYSLVIIAGLLAGWVIFRKLRRTAVFITAFICLFLLITLYKVPESAGFSISEFELRAFLQDNFDYRILILSLAGAALMVFLEKVFVILFSSFLGAWMLSTELGNRGYFVLVLAVGLAAQVTMDLSRSRRDGGSSRLKGTSGGNGD